MNFAIFLSMTFAVFGAVRAVAAEPLRYNRDIRPILSDQCFTCHGPDKAKRKGGLRLDVREQALAELKSGATAIVPGRPEKSALVARIRSHDSDEVMPPPKSKQTLSAQQQERLERWIAEGANYEEHWSFIAPTRPEVPRVLDFKFAGSSRGKSDSSDWSANPIDAFILKKLAESGLAPSREAAPEQIIRRMTLDLTGLPPTPAEVDAFVAGHRRDPRSALSALADRLLASKHYGERMASPWLDAARYADSNGYQNDGERVMWRWRDWVIDAFNANMPFDRFTIEQLAGDLLPGATREQRIATGFNRNHRGNAEGGIIPAEFLAEYVVDRVDTTATVWLGLTMGCARCHDHKYDPLSQRDFYQMFAFFNNVPEHGKAIKVGNSPPVIAAPTPAQERKLAESENALSAAEARLRGMEPRIATAQSQWERSLAGAAENRWTITRGLAPRFDLTEALADGARFEDGGGSFTDGAAVFDGRRFISAGDVGEFGYFDKLSLTAWVRPLSADGTILSRMVARPEDSAFASDREGYSVHLEKGRVQVRFTKRWLDDALRVEAEAALTLDRWQHLTVTYDGSRVAAGVKVFVDGAPQKLRVLFDSLNQTFSTKQPFRIGSGAGGEPRFRGAIRDVRLYSRALADDEAAVVSAAENVSALAAIPAPARSARQAAKLRACFLADHAPEAMREAKLNVTKLREQHALLVDNIPTVMVMEEMPAPRETHVLKRGVYDQPGEQVWPGVPASLPAMRDDSPRNRLGFARWLVSPANPLTARVAVNRLWQIVFGTGLVKTAEDFGSQGELPSHPEMLDWLATEFIRSGWDVKAMMKLIVTSAAYRQSSRVTPELLARDPDNRLLARGPRVRLSAEMLRDQALAASGLLVGKIGGPSVKVYQPEGLWKELSGVEFAQDHGEKLRRRSLYSFWKRTIPQPTMATLDAAGREMCSVRPVRTDTPLQALALMNDVTFVEAARALAQRVIREVGASAQDRMRLAFRLVLAREPKPEELRVLLDDLHDHLGRFAVNTKAAESFTSAGESPRDADISPDELAAYTAVSSLILNLDEAITKP